MAPITPPAMRQERRVAVIGGGWAGCAAAVELAQRGIDVTLFESARTLGGRARRVEANGLMLDNGQHILLGAYRETLRLMQQVGIDLKRAVLRLPLQMRYPPASGGMDFIAPRWPAPLHLLAALLRAGGLAGEDKLALLRFSTSARWMDWQLYNDCSVSELLVRFDQTARLTQLMWRPLCIAALNTAPERASARVFLAVLRDSLGARQAASDMLLPRCDLSALFPERAADFITAHGGTVKLGAGVTGIVQHEDHWQVGIEGEPGAKFNSVIVATPPMPAARLLTGLVEADSLSFDYEPITTCYLQYDPGLKLAQPLFALLDDPARAHWGQFVFDRGALDPAQAGLLAVVVSASASAIAMGHAALTHAIAAQLTACLHTPAAPLWSQVISEKRATFACTPDLQRPPNATQHRGLILAGDYTAGEYPATLEAAVRSGVDAARLVISPAPVAD